MNNLVNFPLVESLHPFSRLLLKQKIGLGDIDPENGAMMVFVRKVTHLESNIQYHDWELLSTIAIGTVNGWIFQLKDKKVMGFLVRGNFNISSQSN